MSDTNAQLTDLFIKWIERRASPAERDELMKLMASASDLEKDILPLLNLAWENKTIIDQGTDTQKENIVAAILNDGEKEKPYQVSRIHFLKTTWFRYAAAIIVILTGLFIYYNFSRTSGSGNKMSRIAPPSVPADIPPGYNRAVLTLSDGQKIALDSNASETINDGRLAIANTNGRLNYTGADVVAMNTMTTPRGGQYQLTLSDGTKVWLNAMSSITYPTAFRESKREVTITGEAYFEVTKNKSKPFIVRTLHESINVLGTSFNVNAYADEAEKTTLVEGSIKIEGKIVQPGQAFSGGQIIATNIDQDIAWKNGAFNFNGADLPQAMRILSRWYDIHVKYEGPVKPRKFRGELPRNLPLSEVLKILKDMDVQFALEGKNLIVK